MDTSISARRIREIILEQSYRAHVGHIGSALCVADIIASLYGNVMNVSRPDDPERDRFVPPRDMRLWRSMRPST